jgi:uncharacterized protein YbjT (DUF2867 family)
MTSTAPSTEILLVGATGTLGSRIAHHLLADGAALRLLARSGARDPRKTAALDYLVHRGATVVQGDLDDPDSLAKATIGIDVVVSAVQGGPDLIVDGQVALARAAADNGASRIVPSDFALDVFKSPPGVHPLFDLRRTADEAIAEIGIEHVHVLNGAFMDMFLDPRAAAFLDDAEGVASFWGTGHERFEATTVDDTARYTSRAALDPTVPNGKFAVAGDHVSFQQMTDTVEELTGRTYVRRSLGTAEDLRIRIEQARHADPTSMRWIPLVYLLFMVTGQTSLLDLQNERYPDLSPETFASVARRLLAG